MACRTACTRSSKPHGCSSSSNRTCRNRSLTSSMHARSHSHCCSRAPLTRPSTRGSMTCSSSSNSSIRATSRLSCTNFWLRLGKDSRHPSITFSSLSPSSNSSSSSTGLLRIPSSCLPASCLPAEPLQAPSCPLARVLTPMDPPATISCSRCACPSRYMGSYKSDTICLYTEKCPIWQRVKSVMVSMPYVACRHHQVRRRRLQIFSHSSRAPPLMPKGLRSRKFRCVPCPLAGSLQSGFLEATAEK